MTDTQDRLTLLPCPFCGVVPERMRNDGQPAPLTKFQVSCLNEGCQVVCGTIYVLGELADAARWNGRRPCDLAGAPRS